MKTILTILLTVALGAFAIVHAQQAPPSGAGPMGPGMMAGMHQQMMGLMQQMGEMVADGQMSPERMKQMGDAMQRMGRMMRPGRLMGPGPMGPMGMPEMSKMPEQMAEMQKRMSNMMGAPK